MILQHWLITFGRWWNKQPVKHQLTRESTKLRLLFQGHYKSFRRAAKGSIIRPQTAAAIKDEIEALYADEGHSSNFNQDAESDSTRTEKIYSVFLCALPTFQDETADDINIFSLGVDSLDVLALTIALNRAVRGANVTASTVYNTPTVKQLAIAVTRYSCFL
jgi:aryl carrier-like protein